MTSTPLTILVTGATGKVGRPLVEQLLEAGHRVRALTRTPERAGLPTGVDVVKGDLSDIDTLESAFEGVDAAHLITFSGPDFTPLSNGKEIVDVAERSGVRRVSVLKGGAPTSPLFEAVAASNLQWTHLSPVEFMANVLQWAGSIKAEGVVRDGFGTVRSSMVHEADIAAVAAACLTSEGHHEKEYWITGPQALTPSEKVRTIAEVVGRDIEFIELSRDEMIATWRGFGFEDDDIAFFLEMRTNPPEAGYTVLPTVQEVTGRPARTFAQWVADNAAAFA